MEVLLFIGILIGLATGSLFSYFYINKKRDNSIKKQSVIMLEQIKQVCKLISVEGEFSEIYTHRDGKGILFNLVQFEKKAIIIIHAKVFIGFDLSEFGVYAETNRKTIHIEKFPEPTILGIETDLEYYDIKKGAILKFSEEDLNNLNKKAKALIREKALNSHLIEAARLKADETIMLIKQLVEPAGWKLNAGEDIHKIGNNPNKKPLP